MQGKKIKLLLRLSSIEKRQSCNVHVNAFARARARVCVCVCVVLKVNDFRRY